MPFFYSADKAWCGINRCVVVYANRMKRVQEILSCFTDDNAVSKRELIIGGKKALLLFKPALTDAVLAAELVRSLSAYEKKRYGIMDLYREALGVVDVKAQKETDAWQDAAIKALLDGDSLLFVDKKAGYLQAATRKYVARAVAEPPTSTVTYGPREGFVEDILTNLNLISRRMKSVALKQEKLKLGRNSNTEVVVMYLSNVASPDIVKKVMERLGAIDIDVVLDCHTLIPFLEENPLSAFSQIGTTEKPDVLQSKLAEGRVAVFVDGSPLVLTLPFIILEDYQNSEDYYERPAFASLVRHMRLIAVFIGVLLPGLFVAMETFHFSIFPIQFIVTVMTAANGIPFSPLPEILFVILLFEVIKEASVRMPRAVGMAMSIVGALVLGDTAVKAGIISSPAVMITALSSIAIFTIPNQVGTFSIFRAVFAVLGGLGGLYFLMVGSLLLLYYLCNLNSCGVSYLAPFSPLLPGDLNDTVYIDTVLRMKKRPQSIPNINPTRQGGE